LSVAFDLSLLAGDAAEGFPVAFPGREREGSTREGDARVTAAPFLLIRRSRVTIVGSTFVAGESFLGAIARVAEAEER
jgi:hypothetical protein